MEGHQGSAGPPQPASCGRNPPRHIPTPNFGDVLYFASLRQYLKIDQWQQPRSVVQKQNLGIAQHDCEPHPTNKMTGKTSENEEQVAKAMEDLLMVSWPW